MYTLLALENAYNTSTAKYCMNKECQPANIKENKLERGCPSVTSTLFINQCILVMSVMTKVDVSLLYV